MVAVIGEWMRSPMTKQIISTHDFRVLIKCSYFLTDCRHHIMHRNAKEGNKLGTKGAGQITGMANNTGMRRYSVKFEQC